MTLHILFDVVALHFDWNSLFACATNDANSCAIHTLSTVLQVALNRQPQPDDKLDSFLLSPIARVAHASIPLAQSMFSFFFLAIHVFFPLACSPSPVFTSSASSNHFFFMELVTVARANQTFNCFSSWIESILVHSIHTRQLYVHAVCTLLVHLIVLVFALVCVCACNQIPQHDRKLYTYSTLTFEYFLC